MSKRQKRLRKIRQNPRAVTTDELDSVLQDFGFILRDGKGSHTIYQHPSQETPIVVAAHDKHVPTYIVKKALQAINLLELEEDDDDSNRN